MPHSLDICFSYCLSTPATTFDDQTSTISCRTVIKNLQQLPHHDQVTSSNGCTAASQHTATNIPFLPVRTALPHQSSISATNGLFQDLRVQTFPKKWVVIEVMTQYPHRT
ncbi:hypothetical protein B7P43_G07406 [Cryptotermes secundus]|uniref:Uncharacterized protein n=1 Tax=Cryptotermes secundus TaxID=105785 RepID=A0A2J7RAL5_9NEOP|nr:hypothetical protein B7P43_G07406 [Cryptotermes secundus]